MERIKQIQIIDTVCLACDRQYYLIKRVQMLKKLGAIRVVTEKDYRFSSKAVGEIWIEIDKEARTALAQEEYTEWTSMLQRRLETQLEVPNWGVAKIILH